MKNGTDENYLRVKKMLETDKAVMSDGCKALVLKDFTKLFEEYFDLLGEADMEIKAERGIFTVNVSFKADRVKKFNVLK